VFLQLFIRYNWFAKHLINTHWCLHTFNYLKTAKEILVKAQDTEYFVCVCDVGHRNQHTAQWNYFAVKLTALPFTEPYFYAHGLIKIRHKMFLLLAI
jgi:hypothetical protein